MLGIMDLLKYRNSSPRSLSVDEYPIHYSCNIQIMFRHSPASVSTENPVIQRVVCARCARIKQGCDGGSPCSRCKRLDVECEHRANGGRTRISGATPMPPVKIIRTPTGCLTCKRRRRKCDESQPRCSDCRRLCLECS